MKNDYIQTLHPHVGKTNKRIRVKKYEFIKVKLLEILNGIEPTHTELMEALYTNVKDEFKGGVQQYGTAVKLDPEARQKIKRLQTTPVKYRLLTSKKEYKYPKKNTRFELSESGVNYGPLKGSPTAQKIVAKIN